LMSLAVGMSVFDAGELVVFKQDYLTSNTPLIRGVFNNSDSQASHRKIDLTPQF
jgi:hypothetical protein